MAKINIHDRINIRDFLKNADKITFENFKKTYPEENYTKDTWDELKEIFDFEEDEDETKVENSDYKIDIVHLVYLHESDYDEAYEVHFNYENYSGSAKVLLNEDKLEVIKVDPKACPLNACSELYTIAMEDIDYLRSFLED